MDIPHFVYKLSYKFINYNIISFKSNNIWSKCHPTQLDEETKVWANGDFSQGNKIAQYIFYKINYIHRILNEYFHISAFII